jgi:hypothetical protein
MGEAMAAIGVRETLRMDIGRHTLLLERTLFLAAESAERSS